MRINVGYIAALPGNRPTLSLQTCTLRCSEDTPTLCQANVGPHSKGSQSDKGTNFPLSHPKYLLKSCRFV